MRTVFQRLWIATLLLYLASGMIFPSFSLYMVYRGLSELEIGLVASVATLASLLSTVMLGLYSDAVADREMLQGSIGLVISLVLMAYLSADSFVEFILLHTLYMSFISPYATLSGTIAMDYISDHKGTFFGKFRTSGAVGWIIGTVLGGYILDSFGYSSLFIITSIFFCASAFLYIYGGVKQIGFKGFRRDYVKISFPTKVLANSKLYSLLLSVFTASIGNPAYYTFLPLFMTKDLEASSFASYLAFSITPIAEIPAMTYFGFLSDKIGRKKVIIACLAAYPARFLLTGVSTTPFYAISVQLLHGLTFGGLYVVSIAYITELVEDKERGFALSLYTIATNIGSFIGGYMLAYILTVTNFRTMYMIVALISSFSIPLFIVLERIRLY